MQNTLPRARIVGDFLTEARTLCRQLKILWEPWIRDNCDMSERTAQGYVRIAEHWDEIIEAQTSAPLTSIDGALKLLSRPKLKVENDAVSQQTETTSTSNTQEVAPLAPVPTTANLLPAKDQPTPSEKEEYHDDEEGCVEVAGDLFDDLMRVGQYLEELAAIMAKSAWSRMERDVLHLQVTGLMRVLNSAALALAQPGGLHRKCALAIAYNGDNDKRELREHVGRTLEVVRLGLEWGEIQELVIKATINDKNGKVELV